MYPRLVKTKYNNREFVYLRLLEKVKKNGKWTERILCNLGRQDIVGRMALGKLLKSLRRFTDEVLVTPEEIISRGAKDYGTVLVGLKIWEEIGLGRWIKESCGRVKPGSLGEAGVLAMVLNRLLAPKSELSIYDWMSLVYLPVWQGKKFDTKGIDQKTYAQRFYLTMDWLIRGKETIEANLSNWIKNLFPVDVVFYDITNIQFEGWEKLKQARYGYIRLGRKNHKQVLLGIVMIEGLPVTCHIFRGNRAEKTTLLWVKTKLKSQFNIGKVIFVVDRGMISEKSLTEIESAKDGYIVSLKRRKLEEVEPLFEEDLSSFSPIKYSHDDKILLYGWEAPIEQDKRRIVVYNPIKANEEKEKRLHIIKELQIELELLKKRTLKSKDIKPKEIIASAEKILSSKHGKRYFTYTLKENSKFEFSLNNETIAKEDKLDGKFVIKTTEKNLSLKEMVFKYKDLMDIEDSFKDLKDFIKVAPIFHFKYRRVKAHIFICVLALLLERYLEQKLKKAGINMTTRKAMEKLKNIKVVTNQVGNLLIKYVTPPSTELERLLAGCGIYKLPKMLSDFERVKNSTV